MTSLTQFFSAADYVRALPMLLLTLFALGILLIDLFLPKDWKQVNAGIALVGIAFSAAAVGKLQWGYHLAHEQGIAFNGTAFMGSLRRPSARARISSETTAVRGKVAAESWPPFPSTIASRCCIRRTSSTRRRKRRH